MRKLVALLTRIWIALVATTPKALKCISTLFLIKTELVAIDNKVWEPSNHKAVESTNTNLYAWLTGEDHLITVGEETKSYIFNSNLGTFSEGKRDVTSDIFEFNGSEFTYDGNTHSPNITTKNNIKGVGNFSVKYFKENDPTNEITVPKDVGTYTVKITVEEGDFYKESSGYLTSDDWKFAIKLTPTITTYTDEYDGDAHPVINIDQKQSHQIVLLNTVLMMDKHGIF